MRTLSQTIGKDVEVLARDYLQRQGLRFVVANYNCKCGEIDLIMRDGEVLVFVEVRHRKNSNYGDGMDSVTKTKQRKIIKAASYYLLKNNLFGKSSCRFDVVSSSGDADSELQWIKDAFWANW